MTIDDFQVMIGIWMKTCFGYPISEIEGKRRIYRFLEEALELAQSAAMTKEDCILLIDYVYSRPVGDVDDEIAGTITTLAAFCQFHGLSLGLCAEQGLHKCFDKIDKIREKHNSAPTDSPLPGISNL